MTEKKYRFANHTGTIIWCADQLNRIAYPNQKPMSEYIHKRKWYIGGTDGNYLKARRKYDEACSEIDRRSDLTPEQMRDVRYVQTVYSLANREVQDIKPYIEWASENASKSWGEDVADEMLKSMGDGDVPFREQAVEIVCKQERYRLRKQEEQQDRAITSRAIHEQEKKREELQRQERERIYNRERDGRKYCTETDPIALYFIGQDGFHTVRIASDGVLYETRFSNGVLRYRDVLDRNYPVRPCSEVKSTTAIDNLLEQGYQQEGQHYTCRLADNPVQDWIFVCRRV